VFNIFKKHPKYVLYKCFNLNRTDIEAFCGTPHLKLNDVVHITLPDITKWFTDRTIAKKEIQYQGIMVKGMFLDKNLISTDYDMKSGRYGGQVVFNNIL